MGLTRQQSERSYVFSDSHIEHWELIPLLQSVYFAFESGCMMPKTFPCGS